jgi:hypothetical protein
MSTSEEQTTSKLYTPWAIKEKFIHAYNLARKDSPPEQWARGFMFLVHPDTWKEWIGILMQDDNVSEDFYIPDGSYRIIGEPLRTSLVVKPGEILVERL